MATIDKKTDHTENVKKINWPFNKQQKWGFLNNFVTKHKETPLDELKKENTWRRLDEPTQADIERHFEKFTKTTIEKPKEPIAMMIKDNLNVEIYEEVAAGTLVLQEHQTSDKRQRLIVLDRSKMLGFRWGNDIVRGWIFYEKEAVAYPTNILHDSRIIKQIIDVLLNNRKDLDEKKLKAWGDLWMQIVIGIVILAVVFLWLLPIFGINILAEPTTTIQTIQQTNATGTITTQP